MKIVVFGLSVSSAWGNGHATQWRGILGALARLGHQVTFYERDTAFYARHRDLPFAEGYTIVTYITWEDIRVHAKRALERADVAIVTSYQADAARATELVLGSRALRVFYDLDAPITFELLDRGERAPWIPTEGLSAFDLVLSVTGGDTLTALTDRLGARKVAPLYGCVDTTLHRCRGDDAPHLWDLSYLGTFAAERQPSLERLFVDVATRWSDRRFLVAGAQYPAWMGWPANVAYRTHVAPGDHAWFYGASRATLNLTRGAMRRTGYCPSARIFEAAACGTPVISDHWTGLEQFFEVGREIVVVETADDVMRALSVDLRALARRARERVLAEHTARRRAGELVSLLRHAGVGDVLVEVGRAERPAADRSRVRIDLPADDERGDRVLFASERGQ